MAAQTDTTTAPPDGPPPGSGHEIVRVRVPARSWTGDLRAIKIVWQRELIRFSRDRLRIVVQLIQPFLFLFVLGTGLSHLASGGTYGVNLRTFVYPGVLCMAVLFTAMFSAASIVWDREFGFLREMMVAPVRRSSLVIGKCLGGATVASFQGIVMIAIAPLVGVPYSVTLILSILALQLLLAFSITAFGVMAAARVTQLQSFMALMQLLVLPLFFLSGAIFPVSGLPRWLEILNRIDPLTYAVDAMRKVVFLHLHVSELARHALDPGVTWWNFHVSILLEAGVVALLGLIMLSIAIAEFSSVE